MQYSLFADHPQAFDAFVQAQRAIFSATQFVIDLNKAFTNKSDLTPVYQRMRDLEASLELLLHQTSSWQLLSSITSPVDSEEAVVARSLRCMAGIKLNRQVERSSARTLLTLQRPNQTPSLLRLLRHPRLLSQTL